MTTLRHTTLAAVASEVQRDRQRSPGNRLMLANLIEAVGALAEAIGGDNPDRAYREAIRVAAVALRIAEEGDSTVYQIDSLIQLVASCGAVARYLLQRRANDVSFALNIIWTTAKRMQATGDPTFDDLRRNDEK